MNARTFLAGLSVVPFVLTHGGSGDRLAFQPKAGETMAKRFEVASELELEDMTFELNGQDMSEMMGAVEMALKTTMKLDVTDAYESVAGGRPAKLKRTFDTISSATHVAGSNPQTGATEKDIPASSELEGTTVVFSWNDSDSAYDVAFEQDDKGDEELLKNLWEDLDLRGFLPENEVAADDSWKIPAEAVKALLAPGGDLKLRPEGDMQEMTGMEQFSPSDIVGSLEGEFQAVYSGVREEGGKRVGVVKLKVEAQSAQDLSDKASEMSEKMAESLPVKMNITAFDGEFKYDSEGELLWDLETGLPHSLSLSGEMRMILDISMSVETPDGEQSMEQSLTFAGTQTIALATGGD